MAKAKAQTKGKKPSKTDALRATREATSSSVVRPAAKKKQPELAGFERQVDHEIESLAAAFIEQSDAWAAAQKEANELKLKIAEVMGTKGLAKYRYRDGEETRDFTFAAAKLRVVKVKSKEVQVDA